jgi:hypothetical protein
MCHSVSTTKHVRKPDRENDIALATASAVGDGLGNKTAGITTALQPDAGY